MKEFITIVSFVLLLCNCASFSLNEQKTDSDFLISAISENYPYLQVHERKDGFNWIEYAHSLRANSEILSKMHSEYEYFSLFFKGLNGHSNMIDMDEFKAYYTMFHNIPEEIANRKPWLSILDDESVLEKYSYQPNTKKGLPPLNNTFSHLNSFPKSIRGNVIHIALPTFNYFRAEVEGNNIISFLKEYSDSNKLIIFDLRGNSGGSDEFWTKYLVSPLIKEPITFMRYALIKGGKLSKPFIMTLGSDLHNISELDISLKEPNDIRQFKYFRKTVEKIDPNQTSIPYRKIVVIVDSSVFSASESFASFCKSTHFATLIGQTTMGDGNGFEPIFIKLPKSKLLFRIPVAAGLNSDGSINFEEGTVPDIPINVSINPIKYIEDHPELF